MIILKYFVVQTLKSVGITQEARIPCRRKRFPSCPDAQHGTNAHLTDYPKSTGVCFCGNKVDISRNLQLKFFQCGETENVYFYTHFPTSGGETLILPLPYIEVLYIWMWNINFTFNKYWSTVHLEMEYKFYLYQILKYCTSKCGTCREIA